MAVCRQVLPFSSYLPTFVASMTYTLFEIFNMVHILFIMVPRSGILGER
jgi:hypothetical protein